MNRIRIRYFAELRDAAGIDEELAETEAHGPAELYRELTSRHGFALGAEALRVAINDRFAAMDVPLEDGDTVVFIPPVNGG